MQSSMSAIESLSMIFWFLVQSLRFSKSIEVSLYIEITTPLPITAKKLSSLTTFVEEVSNILYQLQVNQTLYFIYI